MAISFEELKKRFQPRRWVGEVGGEVNHFRSLSENEKSTVELIGIRLSKNGDVEIDADPGKQREKMLRQIAYAWVDSAGSQMIDTKEWERLGELPEEIVNELYRGARDIKKDVADKEAEKNSV